MFALMNPLPWWQGAIAMWKLTLQMQADTMRALSGAA